MHTLGKHTCLPGCMSTMSVTGDTALTVLIAVCCHSVTDVFFFQVPTVLSWQNMFNHNNLYNTQCTFAIWAMKTITDGLIQQGGLKVVEQKVLRRAHEVQLRLHFVNVC